MELHCSRRRQSWLAMFAAPEPAPRTVADSLTVSFGCHFIRAVSEHHMSEDFIYLNVPGLLYRYGSNSPQSRAVVLAFAKTELAVFIENGLLERSAPAINVPVEEAVVRYSDFTAEGQAFVMSGAVERWLGACDKKNTLAAYEDKASLEKRLAKFRGERQNALGRV